MLEENASSRRVILARPQRRKSARFRSAALPAVVGLGCFLAGLLVGSSRIEAGSARAPGAPTDAPTIKLLPLAREAVAAPPVKPEKQAAAAAPQPAVRESAPQKRRPTRRRSAPRPPDRNSWEASLSAEERAIKRALEQAVRQLAD